VALDLGGAVLGWLVADVGKAGYRGAAKFLLGDAQQRALRSAVATSVAEVASNIQGLEPKQRDHLLQVLTEGTGGGEPQHWVVRTEGDLRRALSAWVTEIDWIEFGHRYISGLGLQPKGISSKLADAILGRIQANARDGGPLGPLAEWMWRDDTRDQLDRIELAVQNAQTDLLNAVSLRAPLSRLEREPTMRGRSRIVKDLTATVLSAKAAPRTRILHGLGGGGKTIIALTVARAAKDAGVDVWWVSATDSTTVHSAMQALAIELGATAEEMRFGSTAEILWRKLEKRTKRWLLIVDNADDPQALLTLNDSPIADGQGWIRPIESPLGMALVTTRDGSRRTWRPARSSWLRLHQVKPLTAAKGGQVLRELAGPKAGPREEAALLSERLGGLPLALRLVGRYLAESAALPTSFADESLIAKYSDYRRALDEDAGIDLFSTPSGVRMSDAQARELIGYTWELSLNLLADRGLPQARPLLRVLSTFAGSPLQYGILLESRVLQTNPDFREINGRQLWNLLLSLASLGLIEISMKEPAPNVDDDPKDNQLTIHPLVRDATWMGAVSAGKATEYTALAVELMESAVKALGGPDMQASWPQWNHLYPHAFQLWERVKKNESDRETTLESLHLADLSARYILSKGFYAQVEEQYRDICRHLAETFGEDDGSTLLMRHRLAHVLEDRGKFEESEAMHRSVLEIQGRVFGEDARRTLVLRECLVSILQSQDRLAEAEAECRTVLATMTKKFDEQSEYVLACRHHLAHVLLRLGRVEESLEEHLKVVVGLTKNNGLRDYNTLAARNCLATALGRTGKMGEALREYRSLLNDEITALGPLHQITLLTQHQLAHLLEDLNMVDEAEAAHRAVLDARSQLLGENHPQTLASRVCLAVHLRDRGFLTDAVRECRIAVSALAGVLEPNHPQTMSARLLLATVLRQLGDPAAREEAAIVLEIALSSDSPDSELISACARIIDAKFG
jgi:tetratricopeptide (TPR) repeat protein